MAYIRCNYGGGSGPVEVVTGTITGAAGNTSAGQVTVTSQQGKTPKRAMFWRTDKGTGQGAGGTFWFSNTDNMQYNYCFASAWAFSPRSVPSTATNSYYSMIYALTPTSITFACPTHATYYGTNATWEYSVEFE